MNTLFATYSGKLINFKDIDVDLICLEDIAHHLTQECRFGGSLPLGIRFSVASHSLNCFQIARTMCSDDEDIQRLALMHDATEAYLRDIPSGLKSCIPDYKKIETHLHEIIAYKYNLLICDSIVEEIDKRIFLNEVLSFVPSKYDLYYNNQDFEPYDGLRFYPDKYPSLIKNIFLDTCKEVGIHD